jgi:hypothetical protein
MLEQVAHIVTTVPQRINTAVGNLNISAQGLSFRKVGYASYDVLWFRRGDGVVLGF